MSAIMPNIRLHPKEIAPSCIVCGDPFRAEKIAGMLAGARELAHAREYRSFIGEWRGRSIMVTSHGVGSPGAAVCFEELIRAGVKRIVRVGTAGSYSSLHPPGSLVISRAAVREEGLTRQLVPLGFPAVADHRLTETLEEQAKTAGKQVSTGITLTLDAFYQGVEPFPHEKYKQAGVIAVEMEIAALYIIGTLRSIQTAAIVAIDGYADADLAKDYNPHTADVAAALEDGIRIALNALSSL